VQHEQDDVQALRGGLDIMEAVGGDSTQVGVMGAA
jgi:hypothetical protein